MENLDDTHPVEVVDEVQTAAVEEAAPERKRVSWFWWLLLGVFVLLGVVALSGLLGYQKGIAVRQAFESTQIALAVEDQFARGVQDLEEGRYEIARQRFEYVIQLDPNYPGATSKLAEALLVLNITATPTPAPTLSPTTIAMTPTPDLRGEAELFAQAEDFIANREWSQAIETLELLRKNDPEYRAVDVDGMLYLSLRNRGVQKISLGDLEGGIYDLGLAERFGILDTEADSWRTWAAYYIRGASFWEVDWEQAVYYFEQVAPMYPNMHDGTGWFASQRYLEALIRYGEYLAGLGKYCKAEVQYKKAYEYSGDPSLEEMIVALSERCR